MTISSLSSPDYYSTITNSSKTHKSSTSNPLNNALTAVEGDLESGDTTDASTVLTNLLANAPGSSTASSNSTASSGSSSVGDQITSYLKSLQSALSSGDTSTAKNILTKLNDYLAENTPSQPPSGANGTSSSGNPLENALAAVGTDLQSGDTSDASSLLTNLLDNAPGSSTGSSSSTASSGSSSVGGQITSYLKSLQSALSSGDTSTAKNILTQLNNYLTANAPTGAGMYSSDGTVTSASSSSANALNTIV